MTAKFSITLELSFNDEDIDLKIKTQAEEITEILHAAIASSFKENVSAYAELAVHQGVRYGEAVQQLSDAHNEQDY